MTAHENPIDKTTVDGHLKEAIARRIDTLRAELAKAQRMLSDLEHQRQSLSATALRIEGALHVLRELDELKGATEPTPPTPAGES